MSEEGEVNQAEVEAKQFGWVPQEDFKGNPDDWRDADTFLKRGKEINGFLRKDLEKIQRTLQGKDAEIAEIRATMEEFRKYHNETEKRAYARAIDDLKREKAQAIEQGDGSKVVELDEQIVSLKEAQAKPKPLPQKPVADPKFAQEFEDWSKENTWFQDEKLAKVAVALGETIKRENPNMLGKEFLKVVTEQMKEIRPDIFENPNRQNSAVGGSSQGGNGSFGKKKKSYENLPVEAKKACDKFVKQKLMTVEQYVSEYDWE